jgi:hypothetical protein
VLENRAIMLRKSMEWCLISGDVDEDIFIQTITVSRGEMIGLANILSAWYVQSFVLSWR